MLNSHSALDSLEVNKAIIFDKIGVMEHSLD